MSDTNTTSRQRLKDLTDWWLGKKKPAPPTPPQPVPPPKQPTILELVQFFRNFNIKEYLPALISIPVVVFLAISGFVMWVVTILKFLASLLRTIFRP